MAINEQLTRLGRGLKNLLLFRRMPAALASWRLLLPTADPCIRAHRAMWRHALHPRLPLPVAIAVEVFVWLRWVLCYAWIDNFNVVRHGGADMRADGGGNPLHQFACLLWLALLHSIHPADARTLRLYRAERRRELFRYVYGHEVQAWHRWRSAGRDWLPAVALLADKQALTHYLQQLGLPAVEILAVLPQGSTPDFSHWLARYPALFCKPRSGSRGEGAFPVAAGQRLTTRIASLLATADYLLQPRLANHPLLNGLVGNGALVELRVITDCSASSTCITSAFLHLPVHDSKGEQVDRLFFPVDAATGTVMRPAAGVIPPRWQSKTDEVMATLAAAPLPGWPLIRDAVLTAHQGELRGAMTIAWDVVITPDGPRILEGNSGWGVVIPQLLSGPLLPVD